MKSIKIDDFESTFEDKTWDQLIELDLLLGNQAWNQKSWEHYFSHWVFWRLVRLEEEGQLNAFSLFLTDQFGEEAHLLKIIVSPRHRRRGEAKEMLDSFRAKYPSIKSIFLEVKADNFEAISFYQKYGFQILHLAPAYYEDGSDALKMIYYSKMM